jgi:hypothetical protein
MVCIHAPIWRYLIWRLTIRGDLVVLTGPIIRVTPNEVHWNDPEFLDTVYPTTGRKTDKPVWLSKENGQ